MFDLAKFAELAPEWAARFHYHAELDSTNEEALRLCESGITNPTVVLADHQLVGRGRRGAPWMSEVGSGLLFSLILKPDYEKNFWSRLALASGLAIANTLREQWNLPAEVKWPNDVFIEGKKCCGILVETKGDYAVVGVGINVTGSPLGDDSVALNELTPHVGSREELLAALLYELEKEMSHCEEQFDRQLIALSDLCYLSGKEVTFRAGGEICSGCVQGISEMGELTVKVAGEICHFSQADSIRLI